jgi:hypothetical protein
VSHTTHALLSSLVLHPSAELSAELGSYSVNAVEKKHNNSAELKRGPSTSSAAPRRVEVKLEHVRCLLKQVELPHVDTHVIESLFLPPACPSPLHQLQQQQLGPKGVSTRDTHDAAGEDGSGAHATARNGPRPLSSSSAVPTDPARVPSRSTRPSHAGTTAAAAKGCSAAAPAGETTSTSGSHSPPAPPPSPPHRPTLAALHVNRTISAHRSGSGCVDRRSEVDGVAAAVVAAASAHSSGVESPLLSLKLLKGSKHACYYLHDEPATVPSTQAEGAMDERASPRAAPHAADGEEAEVESGSPVFPTEGPAAAFTMFVAQLDQREPSSNIIDTEAVLGSNSNISDSSIDSGSEVVQAPRLTAPSYQPSASAVPPRAPHSAVPITRRANGSSSSSVSAALLSLGPSSISASSSSSSFERLLTRTEEVLMQYKAALTAALQAVEHREAVWTALQHFLYVVRKGRVHGRRDAVTEVALGTCAGRARVGGEERTASSCSPSDTLSRSPSVPSVAPASSGSHGEVRALDQAEMAPPLPLFQRLSDTDDVSFTVPTAETEVRRVEQTNADPKKPYQHSLVQPLLRTALCLSLDQLLAQPAVPSSASSMQPLHHPRFSTTDNTPSSSGEISSPQPSHTPRPPLLLPSAASAVAAGTASQPPPSARRRAHSAATSVGNARGTSLATAGKGAAAPSAGFTTLRRLTLPTQGDLPAPAPVTASTAHGTLPAMQKSNLDRSAAVAVVRQARLPQRRTASATGTAPRGSKLSSGGGDPHDNYHTPLSSARGTSALQRSQSAPRVPPIALLSPRPPSGRVSAVTPRARMLSGPSANKDGSVTAAAGGGGGCARGRQPCTPSAPRCSSSAAATGRTGPRQPQAPFIRRVPTTTSTSGNNNQHHHLSRNNGADGAEASSKLLSGVPTGQPYATSLSAHDGVVSLETAALTVPRRVYADCLYHYLFYLQQTTLAVVEAVADLRDHHFSHPTPFVVEHRNYLLEVLTQTATLARDGVVQWLLHDQSDGLSETAAATAAAQTHSPLNSSGNSTNPKIHTPLRASRSSTSASPYSVRRSSSQPTQAAEQAEETAAHRAVQVAAVQGRWPEQLLCHPLLSSHASLTSFAHTPVLLQRLASLSATAQGAKEASRVAPSQLAEFCARDGERRSCGVAAGEEIGETSLFAGLLRLPDAVLQRYGSAAPSNAEGGRSVNHPSSAAVVPTAPLPSSQKKRLEKSEGVLHREVAVALTYLRRCMQCALRREYPLLLRGMAAVHADYAALVARSSAQQQQHPTMRTKDTPGKPPSSSCITIITPHERRTRAVNETQRSSSTGPPRGGTRSCPTVAFTDESLRGSWMEELKVSWQLLMCGSSNVE